MKQAIFAVVLMLAATICVTGCQSGALTYQTKTAHVETGGGNGGGSGY